MKKLLIICTALLTLSSCNRYIQIATFSSDNVTFHENLFAYIDNAVAIEYLFNKSDGIFNFTITNLSQEDIYIDLSKSIFALNGQIFDYAGYSLSKFSSYSHINTYTNVCTHATSMLSHSDITTSGNMITFSTPNIIIIPSNCYRVFSGFEFNNEIIIHADIDNSPKHGRVAVATFIKEESPWKFLNKINIITQDQEYSIENLFYLSKLSNEKYTPETDTYNWLDNNQHYQIYTVYDNTYTCY